MTVCQSLQLIRICHRNHVWKLTYASCLCYSPDSLPAMLAMPTEEVSTAVNCSLERMPTQHHTASPAAQEHTYRLDYLSGICSQRTCTMLEMGGFYVQPCRTRCNLARQRADRWDTMMGMIVSAWQQLGGLMWPYCLLQCMSQHQHLDSMHVCATGPQPGKITQVQALWDNTTKVCSLHSMLQKV